MLMVAITAIKLILLPLGMYWLTGLLGGDRLAQGLALLAGASPGAAASYVMARQMGGDAPLMAGVVAMTTVVSAFTIPILLAVLFRLGLLVDALMSCSIGTAMESSKASNRFGVNTGGREGAHRHEDVHGDGVDATSRHHSNCK